MKKHAKLAKETIFGEVLQHLHTCQTVSNCFHGRDTELSTIKDYFMGCSKDPLILHGEPGCGKTSVLAKAASSIKEWRKNNNFVMVLRFLGTSPDSSSIIPLLTSLCEQIAHNYEVERNKTPKELSKLFAHFKKMTSLASEEKPLFILLDSLDLLSPVDGAHELLWFPPAVPPHVKLLVSITTGLGGIFKTLQRIVESKENYIPISVLGYELAEKVILEWLKVAHRTLSQRQFEIVKKAMHKSSLPLFVKLVFATVCRWRSYSRPQDTLLAASVQESIHALFDRTESQHGKLLVSHALSYITASKNGISESELEDLISLDDKVLDDVYQYHLPPVRRIPPLLWTRIRADLPGYFSERDADSVIVLNWYHRQFQNAASERYFKNLNHLYFTHSSLADYFMGIWGGVPKPFQYTEVQRQRFGIAEKEGLADRKVPQQPNLFLGKDGKAARYNMRKLNELPYHLLRANRYDELFNRCLFNYEFLQSKLSSFPLQAVLADFEDAASRVDDRQSRRELALVADALRLSASMLSKHAYMLPFELLGRLLPLIGDYEHVKALLLQCDVEGIKTSCLVPTHHCFHAPGGPLKYSMEDHPFAVFGMKLTTDSKMLVTVSNHFIVWDVHSGEVARVVHPGTDGIMFGLGLSSDDKYAASYTNNNQIVLMSLITGDYHIIEPDGLGSEQQMQIIGITMTKNSMLFWTTKEWFIYGFDGNLKKREKMQNEVFLLKVIYESESEFYIITWNGDREDVDLTLSSFNDSKTFNKLAFKSAMVFSKNHTRLYMCSELSANFVVQYTRSDDGWKYNTNFHLETGDDERIITLSLSTAEEEYLVGMESYGFHIWRLTDGKLFKLKLPDGVRNIPLRPMDSTTPTTFTLKLEFFIAAVRTNLYIFSVTNEQLIQALDAHFGRILSLIPLESEGHCCLLTASIDHSIRLWNLNNIFEKSFNVERLDKSIEAIHIAGENQRIAAVLTRKYVAVWDIKWNKMLATLAANVHGAVVTHCLPTPDGKHVVAMESDVLLLWDTRMQSVVSRTDVPNVRQLFYIDSYSFFVTVSASTSTGERKRCKLIAWDRDSLKKQYEHEYSCYFFHNVVVMKGAQFLVAYVNVKGKDWLQLIHAQTGTPIHKVRARRGKQSTGISVRMIKAMPHNPNQVALIDSEHRGYLFDMKHKKMLREVEKFSGPCTQDGKLGLYAPPKGGLQIVDIRKGYTTKVLIPIKVAGLHDVKASFSPSGRHVLYYYNGDKTLSMFRVSDGQLISCFRPHAQLNCFVVSKDNMRCLIGGEDGSLLIAAMVDPADSTSLEYLAKQPTRKALAQHLGLADGLAEEPDEEFMKDLRSLKTVEKAVQRFKALKNKQTKSSACAIQ